MFLISKKPDGINVCVCNWMAHKYKSLVVNNHKLDNIQHDVSPEGLGIGLLGQVKAETIAMCLCQHKLWMDRGGQTSLASQHVAVYSLIFTLLTICQPNIC